MIPVLDGHGTLCTYPSCRLLLKALLLRLPAHDIAQANRKMLGISGMDKIVACDQSQSLDDFMRLREANGGSTPSRSQNCNVAGQFPQKKRSDFKAKRGFVVRSEGGRICCDFNGLPEWTKTFGAFRAEEFVSA